MEHREAIQKIDVMKTVSEKARYHLKEVANFCVALGGEVERVLPPEYGGAGYEFATLDCHILKPVTATALRRTARRIEVITTEDKRHILYLGHPMQPPPMTVVWQDTKRQKIRPKLDYYYLAETGIDSIEGKFQIGRLSAGMQRNGKYLNLAL